MNIPYDLAEKMKRLGFPQKGRIGTQYYNFIGHPRRGVPYQNAVTTQVDENADFDRFVDYIKIPSLEEVLLELGEKFMGINKHSDNLYLAYSMYDYDSGSSRKEDPHGFGETPLEAVCNLYVAVKGQSEI